jgi:flagellar biosynthesis/type III secretory pathway chaperone
MSTEIPTITIDGTEYVIDNLSEEHRNIINHIQVADQEIARLQTVIAILTTGRQAYINQLGDELGKDEGEFTPEVVQ